MTHRTSTLKPKKSADYHAIRKSLNIMSEEYSWRWNYINHEQWIEVGYPSSDYDDMVVHAEASGFYVARFDACQFDSSTWQVIDTKFSVEVCVCKDFEEQNCSAEIRAKAIANVLNESMSEQNSLDIY